MNSEDNHNHFCIYCGAKLDPDQHFCTQCGKEVDGWQKPEPIFISKYWDEIDKLESQYDLKQKRAKELLDELFGSGNESYNKFSSAITRSNQLFINQVKIARKMIELENSDDLLLESEIKDKLNTLYEFIDKMEDLINELVIQLSSNKDDNEDIHNLFEEMNDLINSVKDY